ncbi:acyl-CoA N-acyltransferase [Pseudomassariella vexata]|uniref:Acyl-CoA N-acyltransferase n=1 Tax=Pseudomassariella vexata TaxID=1141098 RepID=A0A1Y2E9S4_9PEZI|nr:acyl-CoA N-acyltransferase [Pseudomassariella vexata]ORY68338.1 acyl-CoA N-acyltransferase [Pseudomassariella vexata]
MPLELLPATAADARLAIQIRKAAYDKNPFLRILFPVPPSPEAIEFVAQDLEWKLARENSNCRAYKVVDTDIEDAEQTMIAFAKWDINNPKPEQPPKSTGNHGYGPGSNDAACRLVFDSLQERRDRIIGDRPHVYLDTLYTDPLQQKRGAGGLLVKQCLEEAKALGIPTWVESSEAAHKLYLKCGFRDVDLHAVDLSQWDAPDLHQTWLMIREL